MNSDTEHSLEVKLAAALLEEVFKGLSKKVHNHNMVSLVILGFLISDEVKIRHTGYRYIGYLFR